jgi:hypothetical protein
MDLLETDTLDVPFRHRSVVAIFDGTWRRLEPAEQAFFSQLCVFHGGFTRQAAREITGVSLRQLAVLMNKSLLLFNRQVNRYHIHRLLRHYGLERLAADPSNEKAVKDRHCAYFAAFLQARERGIIGPRVDDVVQEIDPENENVRVAWNWACENRMADQMNQALECLLVYYAERLRFDEFNAAVSRGVGELSSADRELVRLLLARLKSWQGTYLDDIDDLALVKESLVILQESSKEGPELIECWLTSC